MADNLRYLSPDYKPTSKIGAEVDSMVRQAETERRPFELRWYDNHFFDDGYHFRFISRTTGRVVDLSEKPGKNGPQRAIPKASRQIRGMINLLLSGAYVPVARPMKIQKANFGSEEEYQMAQEMAKDIAKRSGQWLDDQMRKKQDMDSKLAYMLYLAALERVAWIQVYPDPVEEKVCTVVRDNFDMYYKGDLVDYEKSPYMVLCYSKLVSEVKANEYYDPEATAQITPDNKFAHSEIKQAYKQARMGNGTPPDNAVTVIVKEAYLREFINDDNIEQIKSQKDGARIMKNRKKGDPIIRQVHVVGDTVLYDVYTSLPGYPFVPYMYEPGPMYGPALIERFIPQNKSLDVAVSRLERFLNTMTVGVWLKRKGESFEISNKASGQVIEYEGTQPVQGQVATPGEGMFRFLGIMESFIEEQGVTTTALGKLPSGVRANAAIESLKASEFANLKVPLDQLKKTIQKVCEKMLDIADNYFTEPQAVEFLNKGEPDYFDVIGNNAIETYRKLKKPLPEGVVPLSKDYGVDISIESGLGFTPEGKRASAKELVETLKPFFELGALPGEVMKPVVEKLIETYQFGNTEEITEGMKLVPTQTTPLSEEQLMQIKVGIAEVLKDLGLAGPGASEERIQENKIGVVEALKDTGMLKPQEDAKAPSQSIPYKELPPEGRVQMAAAAGIELTPEQVITDDERRNAVEMQMKEEELALKQEEHAMKMQQQREAFQMKAEINEANMAMKAKQTEQGMAIKQEGAEQGFKLKKKSMKQQMELKEEMMKRKAEEANKQPKKETKSGK